LVAAVYEFDHWVDSIRQRDAYGVDGIPETVSPMAKVQSISSVYFPQFDGLIREWDLAVIQYRVWIHTAGQKRLAGNVTQVNDGLEEAYKPYWQKRDALMDALKQFAREEFQ